MATNRQINAIAVAFVANLARDIDSQDFAGLRRKNRQWRREGDADTCASHDYCDANMPMFDAFVSTMGREPRFTVEGTDAAGNYSPQAEADLAAFNEAWRIADRDVLSAKRQPAACHHFWRSE